MSDSSNTKTARDYQFLKWKRISEFITPKLLHGAVTTVLTVLDGNTNTVTHRSKGKPFNANAKRNKTLATSGMV